MSSLSVTSRRALIIAAAALAAGCTTVQPLDGEKLYSGRFSMKLAAGEKRENVSGNYRVRKGPNETVLEILTPLMGILARVVVSGNEARLERPGHEDIVAANARELMLANLGFYLPVENLSNWLDGRPASGSAKATPRGFEEFGWSVEVKRRGADALPSLVAVSNSPSATRFRADLTLTVSRK